jgi:hypothetical protein
LQHFDDAKCCYLFFLCFDFCKLWRAVILFFSNAQCVGCSSIWIELLFEEAALSAQPEILDAHEAKLAVLIPNLKRDLKTSSNRWQEELCTDYRQTVTLIR